MATEKKAVTVYLDEQLEDYIKSYCQYFNTVGKDKHGSIVPRWGTGIVELLTFLSQIPVDNLTNVLNLNPPLPVMDSQGKDDLRQKYHDLEYRLNLLEQIVMGNNGKSFNNLTDQQVNDSNRQSATNNSNVQVKDSQGGLTNEDNLARAESCGNKQLSPLDDDEIAPLVIAPKNTNFIVNQTAEDVTKNNQIELQLPSDELKTTEPEAEQEILHSTTSRNEIKPSENEATEPIVNESTNTPKKKNKPVKTDSETANTSSSEVLNTTENPFTIDETTSIVKESNGESFTIRSNLKVKESSREYEVTGTARDEQLTENKDQKVDEENPYVLIEAPTTEKLEIKSEEITSSENKHTELNEIEGTNTTKKKNKPLKSDSQGAKLKPLTPEFLALPTGKITATKILKALKIKNTGYLSQVALHGKEPSNAEFWDYLQFEKTEKGVVWTKVK